MTSPFIPPELISPEPDQPTWYDIVDSPVGRLMLTGDGMALSGLFMMDTGGRSMTAEPQWSRRPGTFGAVADQLAEYFAGSRTEFELPLAPRGTPFQLAVWAELTRIPYGVTASYGAVAAALGKSALASRAVGLANGRNPISIIVPCHRVIGADGSLTGYGGGLDRKEWLLRHENAPFGNVGRRRGAPSTEAQPTLW